MKAHALTSRGIDVRMRHLPDCPGPKVGIFEGHRGDVVARCNRCAERRVVTPRELARIRQQLATTTNTTEGPAR